MISICYIFLAITGFYAQFAASQAAEASEIPLPSELEGTWASKSQTVLTGPDFYDPISDHFLEPRLPGLSFSFLPSSGHFEESRYEVIANPTTPNCPSGILQFQHGSFRAYSNGSLILTPIARDGRQLYSDPCEDRNPVYTRWNVTTVFKGWAVELDKYKGKQKLQLYRFDGSPVNPLWLVYRPPKMLPLEELDAGRKRDGEQRRRMKRELEEEEGKEGLGEKVIEIVEPDAVWWAGVVMVIAGLMGWFLI